MILYRPPSEAGGFVLNFVAAAFRGGRRRLLPL